MRWTEQEILDAIRIGFEIDPSPTTAAQYASELSECGVRFPLYRVARILWMLAHTGHLESHRRDGEIYFRPRT